MKNIHIYPVESPDDGGWYCELVDAATGATITATAVFDTERDAIRVASEERRRLEDRYEESEARR